MNVPGVATLLTVVRHRKPPCVNGCGRPALQGHGKFCLACLSGDCPLPCPALTPTAYLDACVLEREARGEARLTPAGAVKAEQADRLWWMVVEREGGRRS